MPLVSKRLTVDGSAIREPKNVRVPIGALVKDVIAFCGGYKEEAAKLLYGGPMMGTALASDEMPVMKQNNAILAFNEGRSQKPGADGLHPLRPLCQCLSDEPDAYKA